MSLQAVIAWPSEEPTVAVLTLCGEVNSETASIMDQHVDACLRRGGRVVIDFSNTEYVSSSGWRGLIDRCSKSKPAAIAVACMQPGVHDVYDLLGMKYVLRAFDTVRDAVAALAAPVAPDTPAKAKNPSKAGAS